MAEMNYVYTYFVCNVVTGDVFEIMKSGFYTDKQCIEKLEARAAARGKEYRVFILPWDATFGDAKEYGKNAAYFFAWQKERMPIVFLGTQKAIDVLTNGMEESNGEAWTGVARCQMEAKETPEGR